jgi:hypothetical protein
MKRKFFRRLGATLAVYVVALLALVMIQFSSRTGFTLNLGSAVVTGRYASAADARGDPSVSRPVSGPLALYFSGLEFRLDAAAGLSAVDAEGKAAPAAPVAVALAADRLTVRLADGSALSFAAAYQSGAENLAVAADLAPGAVELRLPFAPQRAAKLEDAGKGRVTVAVGDQAFTFYQAAVNLEKRYLAVKRRAAAFSYGPVLPEAAFAAADFTLPEAADDAAYGKALERWKDSAYAVWERAMAGSPTEDVAAAYVAESARRGAYRSAIATTPKDFVDGPNRGYKTAPYFGQLDLGLRSLEAAEREYLARISRLVNEGSADLFAEPDLIAYLSIRGGRTLADGAAAIAKAVDPESLKLVAAVGMLESWTDWRRYRPTEENPFDRLVDQARFVVSAALRRAPDGAVYPVAEGAVDCAFALRAGRALERFGAASGDADWRRLGRSLTLSVLRLADANAAVPAALAFPADGTPVAGAERIGPSAAFRTVGADSLPHAVALPGPAAAGLWAWTAAEIVGAETVDGALDIAVRFPAGETHYLLLRGVKPFAKIQLYGIDYRTDPRFERYDSSGWAYAAEEQTLMLKMKHKAEIEHIRIYR